jgi:hypothetical protein
MQGLKFYIVMHRLGTRDFGQDDYLLHANSQHGRHSKSIFRVQFDDHNY